ncbi:MAG: hypothetical protein FWG46_00740 [Treponema sp.]|nr:hypothetical protein [Treponema sp.]
MHTFLKKTIWFSAAFAAILVLFLTCENPLSNNMGGKVTVEPPTITIEDPVSGAYLKGIAVFTGKATAYRELSSVEVKIFNLEDGMEDRPIMDWTSEGIEFEPTDSLREKNWRFDLDTLRKVFEDRVGLEDGIVKLQFRARDPNLFADSIELVYIVKNNTSDVRLTSPHFRGHGGDYQILTGTEIRGQITDRKGLKPGYPQIKFWPQELPGGEPADDDPNWGWASLFLSGYDNPMGQGSYVNRYNEAPVRVAQFIFNLNQYTIAPLDPVTDTRAIQYELEGGNQIPLPSGQVYRFKIRTSDTFFDEFLKPRRPVGDETEIIGYFPPLGYDTIYEDPLDPDITPITLTLIGVEELPIIRLDNDDINNEVLLAKPNIYINDPTSRKIHIGHSGRNDFRLRVVATHSENPIHHAILEYEHESSRRTGFLKWDDYGAAGEGYVDPRNDLTMAHHGYHGKFKVPGEQGEGRLFEFTADGHLEENDRDNDHYGDYIFTPSSEPYTLRVTVYTDSGIQNTARYMLYLDGDGPKVRILSLRGSEIDPEDTDFGALQDDARLDDPYIVNGNIQVAISRVDNSGIMGHEEGMGITPPAKGFSMVKWVVETATPDPDRSGTTMLSLLNKYRHDPSRDGLDFFYNIEESAVSGWVMPVSVPPPADAYREDLLPHFKFNTRNEVDGKNDWDNPLTAWNPVTEKYEPHDNGKYLWLYIIAQDGVHNLGYFLQKIRVNDEGDKPVLDIPDLYGDNGEGELIDHHSKLHVFVSRDIDNDGRISREGNWGESGRNNILEMGAGIEIHISDDDGVRRDREFITITITDLNGPAENEVTLNNDQLEFLSGNSLSWSGTLSQRLMASALYGIANPPASLALRDGMYKIDFTVTDDKNAKVKIDRPPGKEQPGDDPSEVTVAASYHFAVLNDTPEIEIESPQPNSLQSELPITISGTVRSRFEVKTLYITFTPDVVSPTPSTGSKMLYNDSLSLVRSPVGGGGLPNPVPDPQGFYTYNWHMDNVNFSPAGLDTTSSGRRFSIEAWDSVGSSSVEDREVQVDNTDPRVSLGEFNNNRDGAVHGKVLFTINASDDNGIKEEADHDRVRVKWWIRRAGTLPPDDFDNPTNYALVNPADGFDGQFRYADSMSGGRYRAVIDSTKLENGAAYVLFAMAEDNAGNYNTGDTRILIPSSAPFIVNQARDIPELVGSISPPSGSSRESAVGRSGLTISGRAFDDDRFDPAKMSDAYDPAKNPYVQIRFPASVNATYEPTSWGAWINVPGTRNPAETINFAFDIADYAAKTSGSMETIFNNYFEKDGPKHYQIRITDEPDAGPDNLNFGKNPDTYKRDNPENFPGFTFTYIGAESKTFPGDNEYFSFILDDTPPVITFDNYDPIDSGTRPTYSSLEDLLNDLTGTVIEENLKFVYFTYGQMTRTLFSYDPDNPPADGDFYWSVTADDLAQFETAPQGPHSISIKAVDVAGQPAEVSWMFYKDTRGPDIVTNNISRAISRSDILPLLPGAFPNGSGSGATQGPAWPSDWPSGKGDAKWLAWDQSWKDVIENWPTEYAFFTAERVIAELERENERTDSPTVISNISNNLPFIEGRFQDEFSNVWKADDINADPPGMETPKKFLYRFNSTGRLDPMPWEDMPIADPVKDQKESSASWKIEISDSYGLTDGRNRIDIGIDDSAGNWSYIYGIQFILDRADPYFGWTATPGEMANLAPEQQNRVENFLITPPGTALESETERVFSSFGPGTEAFSLKGYVYEHNLAELTFTIEQAHVASASNYSVTVDYNAITGKYVVDGDVNNPQSSDPRLTVTGSAPLYEWEFTVLQADVAALRGSPPNHGRRHFISVVARDKARRRAGPFIWNFNLDTEPPAVQYSNLSATAPSVFEVSEDGLRGFDLNGTASDHTKVQDVRYSIAKWNYEESKWSWYYNSVWNDIQPDPDDPVGRDYWPSALPSGYSKDNAETSVNWEIAFNDLKAMGVYEEGQYKLDLYVTDWSIGTGNPLDTRDPLTEDRYKSRIFFIDNDYPEIIYAPVNPNDADRMYFKNNDLGRVEFTFELKDANTIAKVEAEVLDSNGDVKVGRFPITAPAGTTDANGTLSGFAWNTERTLTVSPRMTGDGTATGTPLDLVGAAPGDPPKSYTLQLFVFDAAGREAISGDTRQFILDNRDPELSNFQPPQQSTDTAIPPNIFRNAQTGRVNFRGNAGDNSNLIDRVSFFVTNNANWNAPAPAPNSAEWLYNEGGGGNHELKDSEGKVLLEVRQGTFSWEIRIPNTRNLILSKDKDKYVQWGEMGGVIGGFDTGNTSATNYADVRYDGRKIEPGEEIGLITIHVMAADPAGNITTAKLQYWLYPEGDRPVITSITNPSSEASDAERLLNGPIRIRGQARDNERIRYVWFRVINDNDDEPDHGQPYELNDIPNWNETNWTAGTGTQTAKTRAEIGGGFAAGDDDDSGGWYMANRGGDGNTVASWWADINVRDELSKKVGSGASKVIIEVRAEDATMDEATGKWDLDVRGLVSRPLPVNALVVAGAPIFENEQAARKLNPAETDWDSVNEINLRRHGSYRITVKDDNGLGSIRWNRTEYSDGVFRALSGSGNAYNLLDSAYYDVGGTYLTDKAGVAARTAGMAVRAEPHPGQLKTGITLNSASTYIIWEWNDALNVIPNQEFTGKTSTDPAYMRYSVITGSTASIGAAKVIERTADRYYLWQVTVDVYTTKLLEKMGIDPGEPEASVLFPVYLTASDISRPTPLSASRTAFLPIDEYAPTAAYTQNRRPAGVSVPIGGEAGDAGDVSGVARVVLWFSRLGEEVAGVRPRNFLSWHETSVTGITTLPATPWPAVPANVQWADELITDGVIPAADRQGRPILIPGIAGGIESGNAAGSGGSWAIVIDRNDPMGRQDHHGHRLPMGFTNGGMGMIWYVEINSFGMESGPVTMHYVVFDKAGNAKYYEEPLVIMNNAPLIDWIQLGTDIRGNSVFTGDTPNAFTGNVSHPAPHNGYPYPPNNASTKWPLDRIRDSFGVTGLNDNQSGITNPIHSNALNVGHVIDFNVRNDLMAMRIKTAADPDPKKKRNYRVEYVSGAAKLASIVSNELADNGLRQVMAGRVYIIDNPGSIAWGSLGAEGEGPWQRGYTFIAAVNGMFQDEDNTWKPRVSGVGSAWELNSGYYSAFANTEDYVRRTHNNVNAALQINDVEYPAAGGGTVDPDVQFAEFAYASSAFGAAYGTRIVDFGGTNAWPPAEGINPVQPGQAADADGNRPHHSLFILKVSDGPEEDLFCDFALIRVRINNNDITRPFAQLYDLNPMTEGQDRPQTVQRSLTPMFIGEGPNSNRTKGGLWNTNVNLTGIVKPGHIEPRSIGYTVTPYNAWHHSLSSVQMGGAASAATASVERPWANPAGFFTHDTVSGQVILRGYVEDDQRVQRVALQIGGSTFDILVQSDDPATPANPANFTPPRTGLLTPSASAAGKVYFTDTIDLYRHRVEWAYMWDTETIPADTVVGNVTVRALSYNMNTNTVASEPRKESSPINATREEAHTNTGISYEIHNPGFPEGMHKYNAIEMHLRPYITGFHRNKTQFRNDTRSLQGRYIFARAEAPLIKGFNLGGDDITTTISLPESANRGTGAATAANLVTYGIVDGNIPANEDAADAYRAARYRILSQNIQAAATTGDGRLTLTAGSYMAANNGSDRPLSGTQPYIQPWNTERSPAIEGSDLWDDYTRVHIWQSNNTTSDTGADQGRFRKINDNQFIQNPSMSMDPRTGTLWSSHDENNGTTVSSNNSNTTRRVAAFVDPVIMSDIYFSVGSGTNGNSNRSPHPWVVSSFIGRQGANKAWWDLGGVYVWGQGGAVSNLKSGVGGYPNEAISNFPSNVVGTSGATGHYLVEKTYYNSSTRFKWGNTEPASTNQFARPHIVVYTPGSGAEHIHVSYYDGKDGSIKYRHNRRQDPGIINRFTAAPWAWVNLDGGFDDEDGPLTEGNGRNATEARDYKLSMVWTDVIDHDQFKFDALRETHVGNSNSNINTTFTVTRDQLIYTLGPQPQTPAIAQVPANEKFELRAPMPGTMTRVSRPATRNGLHLVWHPPWGNFQMMNGTFWERLPNYDDNGKITPGTQFGYDTGNVDATLDGGDAFRITHTANLDRIYDHDGRKNTGNNRPKPGLPDTGYHNAIAVTSQGYPVIVYYDATNSKLKMAISNNVAPTTANASNASNNNWRVIDNVIPTTNQNHFGTGAYVSIKIDMRGTAATNPDTFNRIHIAAMNEITKKLVYITGIITPNNTAANSTFTNVTVQVVDNVGAVGRWCTLSLDENGNPWISYHDEGYANSKDGVKVAYRNTTDYTKNLNDMFGTSITGWETMHVPTDYSVENGRTGMECFPARNSSPTTGNNNKFWNGAVGYLSSDYFRIAYYVK